MTNSNPQPSPKPAHVTVIVNESPSTYDASEWTKQNYQVVRLDQTQKVVLVAQQGQEIKFNRGQSDNSGFNFGGDSRLPSPSPSP